MCTRSQAQTRKQLYKSTQRLSVTLSRDASSLASWACHAPRRPLLQKPDLLPGHLGGWATPVVGRGNKKAEWTPSKSGRYHFGENRRKARPPTDRPSKSGHHLPMPEPLTTGLLRKKDWKRISAESLLMSLAPVSYTHLTLPTRRTV